MEYKPNTAPANTGKRQRDPVYNFNRNDNKQLNFKPFTIPREVVEVEKNFKVLPFNWKENETNKTLFNPGITAQPI
jgi:hypothetical protein